MVNLPLALDFFYCFSKMLILILVSHINGTRNPVMGSNSSLSNKIDDSNPPNQVPRLTLKKFAPGELSRMNT